MKISDKGLDLIKEQEGYHARLKDGSCKAYLCPAGVWTCGWGCTEGVTANTQWTTEEATEALRREMGKHEANVHRLVTVPLTQGQFDALVSLCYNIGAGNLKKSNLLAHLNAGDYARAASHFADFKYAKVRGDTARHYKVSDGTSVALAGLVTRRAAETQLFLESAHVEAMPQQVEPPTSKMTTGESVAKVATPAAAGAGGLATLLQAPPDLSQVSAWKTAATQAQELLAWAMTNWKLSAAAGAVYVIMAHVVPALPKIKERLS